ncbi:hypothetical protein EAE91_14640 [Photorhabdus noenieputensis]|nr:hypothetical protein [Photorhabdus noenieputensis]
MVSILIRACSQAFFATLVYYTSHNFITKIFIINFNILSLSTTGKLALPLKNIYLPKFDLKKSFLNVFINIKNHFFVN